MTYPRTKTYIIKILLYPLTIYFLNNIYIFFSFLLDLEKIKSYIESFKYGAPPHAGGGIGMSLNN